MFHIFDYLQTARSASSTASVYLPCAMSFSRLLISASRIILYSYALTGIWNFFFLLNILLTSIRVLPLRLYYTSFQVICEMCKSDVGFVLNRNGAGCLTSIMGRWVIPVLDHISCNRSTTRGEAINFRHIHRPYRTLMPSGESFVYTKSRCEYASSDL